MNTPFKDPNEEPFPYIVEWRNSDLSEMFNWLDDLPMLSEEEHLHAWKLHGVLHFSFYREEDAVAFRLKFE